MTGRKPPPLVITVSLLDIRSSTADGAVLQEIPGRMDSTVLVWISLHRPSPELTGIQEKSMRKQKPIALTVARNIDLF